MSAPAWVSAWTTTLRRVGHQLDAVDRAVFTAVATTDTPDLDRAFSTLSRAADHGKLWAATAAGLCLTGPRGRRAALDAMASLAVSSALVNVGAKQLARRTRPDRVGARVPDARFVRMPRSASFPSGHAASAYAFATGVAAAWPLAGILIRPLATAVAYSRVHTGVHYPGDVVVGAVIGSIVAPVTTQALDRARERVVRSGHGPAA